MVHSEHSVCTVLPYIAFSFFALFPRYTLIHFQGIAHFAFSMSTSINPISTKLGSHHSNIALTPTKCHKFYQYSISPIGATMTPTEMLDTLVHLYLDLFDDVMICHSHFHQIFLLFLNFSKVKLIYPLHSPLLWFPCNTSYRPSGTFTRFCLLFYSQDAPLKEFWTFWERMKGNRASGNPAECISCDTTDAIFSTGRKVGPWFPWR